LVKVGDIVEEGQPLIKIDNIKSMTQRDSTHIKELELKAKMTRLRAESEGKQFSVDYEFEKKIPELVHNERSLFLSRQKQINAKIRSLEDQKRQKEYSLKETTQKMIHLKRSRVLINKEVKMMKPMIAQGVKSKVAFMKLQREQSTIQEEYSSAKNSIPRIKASISEVKNNIEEAKEEFKNQAKKELNEVTAEVMRVRKSAEALGDQVDRTMVRSPSRGIIQKLFLHTVGGVVKPGEDLVEIVPTDDSLWLEVKIKPSDIAFVYPAQKTIVKVSAYDFAIYGSLNGEVVHISADTTEDKKENAFYTIHIKTDKTYLGTKEKPLKIIPGMMVNVDILTGKKSVMDYILKPILKAKQYTFTER
jgi:adhesin transport system membrane fusion protein